MWSSLSTFLAWDKCTAPHNLTLAVVTSQSTSPRTAAMMVPNALTTPSMLAERPFSTRVSEGTRVQSDTKWLIKNIGKWGCQTYSWQSLCEHLYLFPPSSSINLSNLFLNCQRKYCQINEASLSWTFPPVLSMIIPFLGPNEASLSFLNLPSCSEHYYTVPSAQPHSWNQRQQKERLVYLISEQRGL